MRKRLQRQARRLRAAIRFVRDDYRAFSAELDRYAA
jgi:hypothetical protein